MEKWRLCCWRRCVNVSGWNGSWHCDPPAEWHRSWLRADGTMAWWSSSSRYSCWCSLTHETHPNIASDKGRPPALCRQRLVPLILPAPLNLIPIWAIFPGQVDAQGCVHCLWLAACIVLLWIQPHHCVCVCVSLSFSLCVCACSVCSAVLRVRFVSASVRVNGSVQDLAVRRMSAAAS